MLTLDGNVIFTNTALTDDGDVWWEGMTDEPPAHAIDWRGEEWTPEKGTPASHPTPASPLPPPRTRPSPPNGRTPPACPSRPSSSAAGGRRSPHSSSSPSTGSTACSSARSWPRRPPPRPVGRPASCAETPSPCCPSCGYNMADYFGHWLKMGAAADPDKLPRIFYVNWFRKGANGRFLWPGYGENSRVLEWVFERVSGKGEAVETPDRLCADARRHRHGGTRRSATPTSRSSCGWTRRSGATRFPSSASTTPSSATGCPTRCAPRSTGSNSAWADVPRTSLAGRRPSGVARDRGVAGGASAPLPGHHASRDLRHLLAPGGDPAVGRRDDGLGVLGRRDRRAPGCGHGPSPRPPRRAPDARLAPGGGAGTDRRGARGARPGGGQRRLAGRLGPGGRAARGADRRTVARRSGDRHGRARASTATPAGSS